MEKRERSIEPKKQNEVTSEPKKSLIIKAGEIAEKAIVFIVRGPKGYFPNERK